MDEIADEIGRAARRSSLGGPNMVSDKADQMVLMYEILKELRAIRKTVNDVKDP